MRHILNIRNSSRLNVLQRWRRNPATCSLIAINVVWYFIVETMHGRDVNGLLQSGAMAGAVVQQGQLFRIVSSMFVHISFMHLLLNMISLWSLYIVEIFFGTPAFIVLYALAGIIGNLVSLELLDPNVVTAGASAAVFGVFGAILALSFQGILSRVARNQLLLLLAINIIYDVTNPDINLGAHIGGLIVGFAFAYVYKRFRNRRELWTCLKWASLIVTGISLFCALV